MKITPSEFLANQTNPALGPTPSEALLDAGRRLSAVAFTKGADIVLTRMKMVSSIVPSSVTKQQLIDMIGREIEAAEAEWRRIISEGLH